MSQRPLSRTRERLVTEYRSIFASPICRTPACGSPSRGVDYRLCRGEAISSPIQLTRTRRRTKHYCVRSHAEESPPPPDRTATNARRRTVHYRVRSHVEESPPPSDRMVTDPPPFAHQPTLPTCAPPVHLRAAYPPTRRLSTCVPPIHLRAACLPTRRPSTYAPSTYNLQPLQPSLYAWIRTRNSYRRPRS
ncbi:hypothetical protein GQ44DRAFT_733464 [Phaeosphaeriaceae sp. PMI808]|nr:hypothetical protein GQ44DRAFT_733464 [Phaeosphaeriaceae sp. PMI808]